MVNGVVAARVPIPLPGREPATAEHVLTGLPPGTHYVVKAKCFTGSALPVINDTMVWSAETTVTTLSPPGQPPAPVIV
jgi:hypothetical protein